MRCTRSCSWRRCRRPTCPASPPCCCAWLKPSASTATPTAIAETSPGLLPPRPLQVRAPGTAPKGPPLLDCLSAPDWQVAAAHAAPGELCASPVQRQCCRVRMCQSGKWSWCGGCAGTGGAAPATSPAAPPMAASTVQALLAAMLRRAEPHVPPLVAQECAALQRSVDLLHFYRLLGEAAAPRPDPGPTRPGPAGGNKVLGDKLLAR